MTNKKEVPQEQTVRHISILSAILTKKGYPVKGITWMGTLQKYVGYVKDPKWADNPTAKLNQGFLSASWNKSGQSVNKLREDLNLAL